MTDFPHSPDDVIDPRWHEYLGETKTAGGPASLAREHEGLGQRMRDVIEPWEAGRRGTRETLKALRELAEQEGV